MRRTESRSGGYIPEDKLRELERKRRQWKKEQELLREHEKRKAKMIAEYEERRARELGLKNRRRTSKSRSRSRELSKTRSRSRSHRVRTRSRSRCRDRARSRSRGQSRDRARSRSGGRSRDRDRSSHNPSSTMRSTRVPIMSEKCDASSSNTPLFKGSEGKKVDTTELKKIKVNIERDIASTSEDTPKDLLRDIVSPEEIVIIRREGEGSKPIFEREELKDTENTTSEVAERRTIIAVDSIIERRDEKRSGRRSRYQSRERDRNNSSHRSARDHDAREPGSGKYGILHKHTEQTYRSRDTFYQQTYPSASRFPRSIPKDEATHFYHDPVRRHRDDGEYSFAGSQGSSYRSNDALPHPETMAFPMYYDNFTRPMMMDPLMMMRTPLPMGRARMPPMMRSLGAPPRPRLTPSDLYRFNIPPAQRYNRMF